MNRHEQLTFLGVRPPVERRSVGPEPLTWPTEQERRFYPSSYLEDRLLAVVQLLQERHVAPFVEAKSYQELTRAPYFFSTTRLAKVLGKETEHVAEILSLMQWNADLQRRLEELKLTSPFLLRLRRLPEETDVLAVAEAAALNSWTLSELDHAINTRLGLLEQVQVQESRKEVAHLFLDSSPRSGQPSTLDPLLPVWFRLNQNPALQRPAQWSVHYRGGLKWHFEVKAGTADEAASGLRLAEWFRKMADALEGKGER